MRFLTHRLIARGGLLLLAIAGAAFGSASSARGAYIVGVDFGLPGGTVYNGTFGGVSAFQALTSSTFVSSTPPGPASLNNGLTLTFNTNVGAYDIGSGADPTNVNALVNSFFYANSATGTVSYTISGFSPSDQVTVGLVGSSQPFASTATWNGAAAVTVPGGAGVSSTFTTIGSGTGATSYTGTFAPNGGTEGDIAGLSISVVPTPEPAAAGLIVLGTPLLLRRRRNA
jgi:MYXO-CTERM domain-containing protein